jgi:uncharacterized membrane protein
MTTDDTLLDFEAPQDQNLPQGPRGETPNVVLMREAQRDMEGYWGISIVASLIVGLITGLVSFFPAGGLLVAGAFAYGMAVMSLAIMRKKEVTIEQTFEGFSHFGETFVAAIVMGLLIVLFCLLLIVPGLIKGMGYMMTYYIMAEDKRKSGTEALEQSQRMMYGYKSKLFRLQLRIFGLGLLCLLTCGVGFFFLVPYSRVVMARFYNDVKFRNSDEANEIQIGNFGLGV